MTQPAADRPEELERQRSYLLLLARLQVGRRCGTRSTFRRRPGDIAGSLPVGPQLNALEAPQRAAWLRRALATTWPTRCGSCPPETGRFGASTRWSRTGSVCLPDRSWLAAQQSSPSQAAQREERAAELMQALAQLRRANGKRWFCDTAENWSLATSAATESNAAAIAGLLKRGLKQLRDTCAEPE